MAQSWVPLVFAERLGLGLSNMIAQALTGLFVADADVTRTFSGLAVA